MQTQKGIFSSYTFITLVQMKKKDMTTPRIRNGETVGGGGVVVREDKKKVHGEKSRGKLSLR